MEGYVDNRWLSTCGSAEKSGRCQGKLCTHIFENAVVYCLRMCSLEYAG
jgi:hypothetical protein